METENYILFPSFFHEGFSEICISNFKKCLISNLEIEKFGVEEIKNEELKSFGIYHPFEMKVIYQNEILLVRKLSFSICIMSKDNIGQIAYSIHDSEKNTFSDKEIFGSFGYIPIKRFNSEFPDIVKILKKHTAPEI